ncbi:DUF2971 domain-containing protein [Aeromonas piscicola]
MQVVYKYLPIMSLDYIDNPTIKLSQAEQLNDPFESNPCENIYESIRQRRLKLKFTQEEAEAHASEHKISIKNRLTLNGIVAFSETPRNSLMWAHYGSHHSGMCIGFKRDLFKNIYFDESPFNVPILEPKKINYDNFRIENDFESEDPSNELKDLINRHLFTKSDEWIYEKEHRSIIPLSATKKIKLIKPNAPCQLAQAHLKTADDVIKHLLTKRRITSLEEDNTYEVIRNDMLDATLFLLSSCSGGVIFLTEIEPLHIDSIYLGCKVSEDVKNSFIQKIKTTQNKGIKLFKFNISTTRFELIPERLN